MIGLRVLLLTTALALPFGAVAQDQQTLADVRQELTVLHVDIQRLKRELSTTGGVGSNAAAGGSVLERVGAIERELQRLTAQTEQLEYRVNRIVSDGTNRIGDLEFRLVELEGGDIGALGETTTLGGGELPAAGGDAGQAKDAGAATGELAIGEQADFDAAEKLLAEGLYQDAAEKFSAFNQAYPGSPLAAKANLSRGKALTQLTDTREAARARTSVLGRVSRCVLGDFGAAAEPLTVAGHVGCSNTSNVVERRLFQVSTVAVAVTCSPYFVTLVMVHPASSRNWVTAAVASSLRRRFPTVSLSRCCR